MHLTVLAPLRVEARAARRGHAAARVVRTGGGPQNAARAVEHLMTATAADSSAPRPTGEATVMLGVAGGLLDELSPGELVVADRVLRADGTTVATVPTAPLLAGILRRRGLAVRVGPVVSTDHLVRGATARAALARTGALAVDLESAAFAGGRWPGPFAVIRAVVDTPSRELVSPATIRGGIVALRALRNAMPGIAEWASAAGDRRVVLAEPRSYCAGVERAVETVSRAISRFGAPVYVRRQIVHNRHVVGELEGRGARFVDELDQVPDGATVIFSAHGVGRAVRQEAQRRDLRIIDATCPLVAKVHSEVRRFAERGAQVILIGHAGHDEVQGTMDEADGVILVERASDVAQVDIPDGRAVAYATQTTLSPEDVSDVVDALEQRWPAITGPAATDICYATHNRQQAVRQVAAECDLLLVVGSTNSSNSIRLVEVAARTGTRARLIDDAFDLDPAWLVGATSVGVTAGASAPESVVARVLDTLSGLGRTEVMTRSVATESVSFSLPLEVR